MNYSTLMSLDTSSFDNKRLKVYQKERDRRQKEVDNSFNRTIFHTDEFTGRSGFVLSFGQMSFILSKSTCIAREDCHFIVYLKYQNACPPPPIIVLPNSPPRDGKPCNFSSAYLKGGIELPIARASFDSSVKETTTQNMGSYLASGGQKPIINEKHYNIVVDEEYGIGLPYEFIKDRILNDAGNSGDLEIKLIGDYSKIVVIDEGILRGFLKKVQGNEDSLFEP